MSSKKQNGLNHGTTINQMMNNFKYKILVIFMWSLISGCSSETPAPPSDYIDEVDMDTFALSSNSS